MDKLIALGGFVVVVAGFIWSWVDRQSNAKALLEIKNNHIEHINVEIEKINKRFERFEDRVNVLEQDISFIKGKMNGSLK